MAKYTAEQIEVLSGLEPVRKRPGMYTDTTRPNHLGQEVIDNSVDEALAGFATKINVTLYKDGSLEVEDDGRGMPVDMHPEEKMSGVELILTKLHSGAKFSNQSYKFSGGLHGVGVSVVNALSIRLEVWIKRDGAENHISFAQGERVTKLKQIGKIAKNISGTRLRFWPEAKYFDSNKFSVTKLKHVLQAKAVLCKGLHVSFTHEGAASDDATWYYEDGLLDYLKDATKSGTCLPEEPFVGEGQEAEQAVNFAINWYVDGGEPVNESYVNLVPTVQGGTHVNGLRMGLLEAMRDFCEMRNLLPRGVKLTPEDIWDKCNYVLSAKLLDPQFAGQTKEKLTSRQSSAYIGSVVKDAFSLWLHQHVSIGESLADLIIANAQKRLKAEKIVTRKKVTQGPALPGKLADCTTQDVMRGELFLVEGDSAGGSAKQARDKETQAIMPLRGKILNTWEVDSNQVLASQEVHDISVALGLEPDNADLSKLRYGKVCILADADSDGLHIATLLCALFLRHFRALVEAGHVYVAMPPLYRLDAGKEVFYALDEEEKDKIIAKITKDGKNKSKISVQRFKGLGEMNPSQLRETTIDPNTRKLLQLTVDNFTECSKVVDLLLSKKRANDRKIWLEEKGDAASLL